MAITSKSRNVNRANQFGTFPQTPNKQWISNWQNYPLYQDATGTPITSPASVAANADTVLNVPGAATQLLVYSSTALRVSDVTPNGNPYFVIPANTMFTVPCSTPTNDPNSTTGQIFLRADASAATVQFMFLCI